MSIAVRVRTIVSAQLGPLWLDLSWDAADASGTIGVGLGAPHHGFWIQLFNLSLQVVWSPSCWWAGRCTHEPHTEGQ